MNHSSYVDEPKEALEDDVGEEELSEALEKVRGLESAKRTVVQTLSKWLRDPELPPASDGVHWIELGYRKVERPIKRFSLEWPEGDIAEVTGDIVETAAVDLFNSTAESESYVIRLYGGNDSRTFPLSCDRDDEDGEPESPVPRNALVAGKQENFGSMANRMFDAPMAPAENVTNMFALQVGHNVELVRSQREMLNTVMSTMSEQAKINTKMIREQQETINRMTKQRFDVIEAQEDILTRKHELEAEAKEAERIAIRNDKLMEVGAKFLLPMILSKLGMENIMQGFVAAQQGEEGTPSAKAMAGLTPTEFAIHSFFESIRPEQTNSLMTSGSIQFDQNQMGQLLEMLMLLKNQYEAAQGGGDKGPNHGQ